MSCCALNNKDICLNIAYFLEPQNLTKCREVCTLWNQCFNDNSIWLKLDPELLVTTLSTLIEKKITKTQIDTSWSLQFSFSKHPKFDFCVEYGWGQSNEPDQKSFVISQPFAFDDPERQDIPVYSKKTLSSFSLKKMSFLSGLIKSNGFNKSLFEKIQAAMETNNAKYQDYSLCGLSYKVPLVILTTVGPFAACCIFLN